MSEIPPPFEPIRDIDLKELLKEITRNCIDIQNDPYDFKAEFIQQSNFDFCILDTEFFVTYNDKEYYNTNLLNYCFKNNYKELFAIHTECIETEDEIPSGRDWYLAYKFIVGKDDFLTMRSNFEYGISALLFPLDKSFFFLLTESYDIIAGSREFIEKIIENDIVKQVDKFKDELYLPYEKNLIPLADKYSRLIHSKY